MPYIGNTIRAADDYRLIDDISSGFNGSETSFALQVAGSAPVPFPKSPQQVLISVNGVIQEPDPTGSSGFNLVGTNIVFSSAPTNGHAFFGIIYATADYLNAGGNFPAGSLGAPSITFIGDENTGLFRKSGGSVGFVSDATEIANFDSNGITISSGNLIIPDSIIHNGDSDTKIRFGSANEFSVETGGVERLELTGTETVFNDTGADTDFRIEGDTNANLFKVDAGNDFIGIGTASPQQVFHVYHATDNGLARFESGDANCRIDLVDNSGQISIEAIGNQLRFGTSSSNTERMRIDSSGNVGIGTASPSSKLHTKVTGADNQLRIETATSGNPEINFNAAGAGGHIIGFDRGNTALTFTTAGSSERMRIDSSGRLLIGTATNTFTGVGSSRLQVSGTGADTAGANFIRTSNDSGGAFLQFTKNRGAATQSGDTVGAISWMGHDGTDTESYFALISVHAEANASNNNTQGSIRFGTSNGSSITSERMRIDPSGNVGIGASSITANTNYSTLQIQGKASTGGGILRLMTADGSTSKAMIFADTAGLELRQETNHKIVFSTNDTARVTISSDGYLTQSNLPIFVFKGLGNAQSGSRMTSDGDMLFTQAIINSTHYDNSNGRFTAPVAGKYYFQVNALLDNNAAAGTRVVRLKVNNTIITTIVYHYFDQTNSQYYHVSGGSALNLSENDYVTFFGSEGWHVGVETNVAGFLIG